MLEMFGAIFIIVVGTLLHFMYDWTDHNKIVGFFTAVNESTWEHIKLLIAPTFVWLMVEYHFYFDNPNLFFAKAVSMLVMIIFVPLVFYSYTHYTKKNILAVDMSSFIVAAVLGQYVFHLLINMSYTSVFIEHLGIFGLVIIFLRYITHTYVPDKNFIHEDPITKKYGVSGHAK